MSTSQSVNTEWLASLTASIIPADPDGHARARTQARIDDLTLPKGSLGRMATLALQLAAIQQREIPEIPRKAVLIFAGDHGVTVECVSAYQADVTTHLCYALMHGGCVVNVLSQAAGADLHVIDVGVDHEFTDLPGLIASKVRRSTRNMLTEPALTRDEVYQALEAGASAVRNVDADIIALGEIGIGNTTAAAAVFAGLTGRPASDVTGLGTGVGTQTYARKIQVIDTALARHAHLLEDPIGVLAAVGGLEIAALTGAILAAAADRRAVLLDGFMTGVAALAATQLAPERPLSDYLIASHRSAERGHRLVLQQLGLEPLLELDLRIGEGSGAALTLPLVDTACRLVREVQTFSGLGLAVPVLPKGLE